MIVSSPIAIAMLAALVATPPPLVPPAPLLARVATASQAPLALQAPASPQGPAASATPLPAPTLDPLAYDDPGMHFRAPDGWKRIALASDGSAANDGKRPPAAIYVFNAGRSEQRTIVIDIQPFEGTLDGFERARETELHSGTDGTFVDRKTKIALANGMPAYLVQVSQPGGQVGHQLRRYDYLIYDLQRSIDVAYIGRYGDFDERDVAAAFASLSVVVYPRRR